MRKKLANLGKTASGVGQLPTPGEPVVDFGHCLLRLEAAR
jgi:hypothetical protein